MIALALALALSAQTPTKETTTTTTTTTLPTWRASPASPRALLAPDPTATEAALRVVFLAGAADDGIEEGLTRLTQYALLHGQDARPYADLDAALFAGGASLVVDTSVRECSFTLTAPAASFPALADRVLALVLAPSVSSAGAKRARDLARTDFLDVGSEKWMQAFVAAQILITEGVEGGGDYNNPVYGDPGIIRRIPDARITEHLKTKLTPANAIVVAAGRFDDKRLKASIARYKGGVERPLRRPDLLRFLPMARDLASTRHVQMQLQVVDVKTARDAAVVHVLAAYLHDRLFFPLRKSGHVYSPYVGAAFEEWLDYIVVMFTVTPGGTLDYRRQMTAEIERAAAGPLDAAAFARARVIARARLTELAKDPTAYADALVARVRGAPTVGPDVVEAIESLTVDEAQAAAARVLAKDHSVSFVFGATRTETEDERRERRARERGDEE